MKHFLKLGDTDVFPLRLQLENNPQLWNENNERTTREHTAHSDVSDIWISYRQKEELIKPETYNEPFFPCVFYPAYYLLNEVKPIIQKCMARVDCIALGGILITKIPPKGQVKWHSDAASWHAHTYRTKAYVTIKSNPQVVNMVEDESLVMKEGEVWYFDNLKPHAVVNNGDEDRITLIISMRTGL